MFGMLVTLKDRFGRKREFHFLNQFWRWQTIEQVYPEFNQHPELLGQVTIGTHTPELDRALTENNIKLWKLTGLMIEADVPNGPDKATLRVLMGLAWIEALLDESRTLSSKIGSCFPALHDLQDHFAFTQDKLPVVMPTTWPTVGAFIRRAVRVPKKSLSREVAREQLLNISYKPNPTEDRFTLLLPQKLEVDQRLLKDPTKYHPALLGGPDYSRTLLKGFVTNLGGDLVEAAQRNDRHYKRASNFWTHFDKNFPDFFTSDLHVAFGMNMGLNWLELHSVFFDRVPRTLEKRCADSQQYSLLLKALPQSISKK